MSQEWSSKQKAIYEGLKNIGEEIAGYFESAMNNYYDELLPNRVSHLAHAAREMDGGLRDIFSPEGLKKSLEKSIVKKGVEKIFGDGFQDSKGHIASILAALDVDEKDLLAKEWITVATNFHKFAHRSGAWRAGRKIDEFNPLWQRYENVLYKLVGSYYAVIARISN